jgi:16S rRNA (guanine527-N7)-methyltransferase
MSLMEIARIAELLRPFTGGLELSPDLYEQLSAYLDLLLRWNARMNLTAVRESEQIVSRHFGESLFTARVLLPERQAGTLADIGSGAGFPGIPIRLWSAATRVTLIESQGKKATFLREVIRTLKLDAEVFHGRAEDWGKAADLVTLRAVEKFESVLPVAAELVAPAGSVGLLIGAKQLATAREILGEYWSWREPVAVPQSNDRVVAVGSKMGGVTAPA